jgi:tetratricopeptide (TPR) repeat protein
MLHFRQRQFELAEVAFQRSLALDPDQPGVRVNQGFILIEQGRHREALALFEELTARFPRAEILLRNRATAKAGLGDLAGARADLAAAQAILPRAESARILADLSSRLGLSADVARWKQEAVKLEPIRR